jgi:hypothetical protein
MRLLGGPQPNISPPSGVAKTQDQAEEYGDNDEYQDLSLACGERLASDDGPKQEESEHISADTGDTPDVWSESGYLEQAIPGETVHQAPSCTCCCCGKESLKQLEQRHMLSE